MDVKAKITEAWRLSKRHGDGFEGVGGHFAGLMVALHPPSLPDLKSYILIGLDDSFIIFLTFNCIILNIFWLFTLTIQELSYNILRDLKTMPPQF